MRAIDFQYDNMKLSDFGFMICHFNQSGLNTVSNGSEITFNTSPILYGQKYVLSSTEYKNVLTAEFDICLKNCLNGEAMIIDIDKQRDIMRWLNRKTFNKLTFDETDYLGIEFCGSFNVQKVTFNDDVIGFHLNFVNDRPFGIKHCATIFNVTDVNKDYVIINNSDEIGILYPKTKITCLQAGDLYIVNKFDNTTTLIKNCSLNEVIEIDNPIISTNLNSHKIQNDFNFNFIELKNNYNLIKNNFRFSLPCKVEMEYEEIVKVSI